MKAILQDLIDKYRLIPHPRAGHWQAARSAGVYTPKQKVFVDEKMDSGKIARKRFVPPT